MRKLIVIALPILLISLMSISVSAKVFSATAHVGDVYQESWDLYVTIDDQAHTWTVTTQTNDWFWHKSILTTCEGVWDNNGFSNQTGLYTGIGCTPTFPTFPDVRNTVITYPYYGGDAWAHTKVNYAYYWGISSWVTSLQADVYVDTCTAPKTCGDAKISCGSWTNNCGQTFYCGSCSTGQECYNGNCYNSNTGSSGGGSGGCGGKWNGCFVM